MPGHSRPKDGVAPLAYVPGIHALTTPPDGAVARADPSIRSAKPRQAQVRRSEATQANAALSRPRCHRPRKRATQDSRVLRPRISLRFIRAACWASHSARPALAERALQKRNVEREDRKAERDHPEAEHRQEPTMPPPMSASLSPFAAPKKFMQRYKW